MSGEVRPLSRRHGVAAYAASKHAVLGLTRSLALGVAASVSWLCLPSSASITGQAIAVAGGEVT